MSGEERSEPIISITGRRIAFGPIAGEHILVRERWFNDFVVHRVAGIAMRPRTREEVTTQYDGAARYEAGVTFALYERATWDLIGVTSLQEIDYRNRTAEFGIVIGETAYQGKGYGTEATRLMLDYAFIGLGLHSVWLQTYTYNHAGQRAFAKAGFKECGRRREAQRMGAQMWDVIMMECLASAFVSPVLASVFAPDEPRS